MSKNNLKRGGFVSMDSSGNMTLASTSSYPKCSKCGKIMTEFYCQELFNGMTWTGDTLSIGGTSRLSDDIYCEDCHLLEKLKE